MESQPQNPDLRNNPENFNPCIITLVIGLARLIEILVNRSIYKRKTIIDMKIQKLVTFNGCSVYYSIKIQA